MHHLRLRVIGTLCLFLAGTPISSRAESLPSFTLQPASANPTAPRTVVLKAEAQNDLVTYQWYEGASGDTSRPIPGAVSSFAIIPPSTSTRLFWVRASNLAGSTDSAAATVTAPDMSGVYLAMTGPDSLLNAPPPFFPLPVPVATGVKFAVAGGAHLLILKSDGTLWARGENASGQLGTGDFDNRDTPVQIASGVAAVAAGSAHSLFLKTDGSLWATGDNNSLQLGLAPPPYVSKQATPTQIATGVAAIAAGGFSSFFLKTGGDLWATGQNYSGQLGTGSTASQSGPVLVASSVAAVSTGGSHTLLLKTDGSVWSAGSNWAGQLGLGDTTNRLVFTQAATGAKAIRAGGSHSLILKADGGLWGAGDNRYGQLAMGDGLFGFGFSPSLFELITTDVVDLAAGYQHSAFTRSDGGTWSMGANSSGQLGTGDTFGRALSLPMADDSTGLFAGLDLSLYVGPDGTLWGVGDNRRRQLVADPASYSLLPVTAARDVISVADYWTQTLLLGNDGTLSAIGFGPALVNGMRNHPSLQPIATAVATVAASFSNAVMLKTDGTLHDIADTYLEGAVIPPLATHVATVVTGWDHTLFVKNDGTLWGYGWNGMGELGIGTNIGVSSPVQIADQVAAAAAGDHLTLFLKIDGSLWSVGLNNDGQLGDGTTTSRNLPAQIATDVAAIACCGYAGFFIKTDGTLWSFGANYGGELGTGDYNRRLSPVQIASGVASLHSGGGVGLFIKTDGSLWATGSNFHGALGTGDTVSRPLPTLVATGVLNAWASNYTNPQHIYFLHRPAGLVAPSIASQPQNGNIPFLGHHTLSISATGSPALTYQWYRGASGDTSQPLNWARNPSYTPPPFSLSASYWCRVANPVGSADSASALVTVADSGPAAYRAWAEAAGLTGVRLATNGDPDADGRPNLLEFAFGASPRQPDFPATPAIDLTELPIGDVLALTHRRNKSSGLTFGYERSFDLGTWEPVSLEPFVTNPDADGDGLVEEITVYQPLDPAHPALFLRVKVATE